MIHPPTRMFPFMPALPLCFNHSIVSGSLFLAFVLLMFSSCQQEQTEVPTDNAISKDAPILILNGLIIDGTDNPPEKGNLFIQNGHIETIDPGTGRQIQNSGHNDDLLVIDASGKIVAPGFIDAHAHGNPLRTPDFDNFLAMGVTTITLGQDGRSPERKSVSAWMDQVDSIGTGVNIIHFTGHGTIRDRVEAPPRSGLSPSLLNSMKTIVDEAMADGSFGLSTALEYNPGYHADMNELAAVARPVARHQGLVMSHLRSEDDLEIEEAIRELIEQGRQSGADVHVSHIKIVYGKGEKRAGEILALMDEARSEGVAITADLYPYTASYTGIGIVFPDWAMPPHDYDSVKTYRREELKSYLYERVMARNGPEATLFGTEPWAGKTLAAVSEALDKPFPEVLIDDIPPGSASAAYFVMDDDVVRRFLADPYVMISSDGSPTMRHPRGYGSFPKIIRQYVMEEKILSLETAIHKMTGLTAETLGLNDTLRVDIPRGFIKEGYAADIVIFDPEKIKDNATFEEPHLLAEGMNWVLVGGVPVIANGERNNINPGRVLRRLTHQ